MNADQSLEQRGPQRQNLLAVPARVERGQLRHSWTHSGER